jgi:hypothetical protein
MKHWVGLHEEKDADDLQAGVDGLLRLASATNFCTSAAHGGSRQMQRPLQIMDANVETANDDMELEKQD